MRLLPAFLLCCLFVACGNDDDTFGGTTYTISPSLGEWLSAFPEAGATIAYRNAAGAQAEVTVVARNLPDASRTATCERAGVDSRCQYENALFRFNGSNPEPMYLAVWLFAEDRVNLMATDQLDRPVAEIARYAENIALFSDLDPEHFATQIITGYLNPDNSITSAFRVVNTDSTGLEALPPFGVTLVKERGIVEWTDRAGQVWGLQ